MRSCSCGSNPYDNWRRPRDWDRYHDHDCYDDGRRDDNRYDDDCSPPRRYRDYRRHIQHMESSSLDAYGDTENLLDT